MCIIFTYNQKRLYPFNDTCNDDNKKVEYFLLGTLVSFTLAIINGLLIKYLIRF